MGRITVLLPADFLNMKIQTAWKILNSVSFVTSCSKLWIQVVVIGINNHDFESHVV